MGSQLEREAVFQTRILPVNTQALGQFVDRKTLEVWQLPKNDANLKPLKDAAKLLRETYIPVGFPTETVYGLGADATRSASVKGIYKAKGRPSDNPLIIHVCDLSMLQNLLLPAGQESSLSATKDLIPAIYKPLIERFWPGPLTILLPNPQPSKLAPEVTAGLSTFGARMPDSPLALSLIHLAGVPLAAPSANASTKPSPTTAEHVRYDLEGKIEVVLDGGPCLVGVESTVVDGMCDPPVVLRPGGVSIDEIRKCQGGEGVVKGYKDQSEIGAAAPRAPGMKYKHYSPKAKVVLYEGNRRGIPSEALRLAEAKEQQTSYLSLGTSTWPIKVGIVRTKHWGSWAGFREAVDATTKTGTTVTDVESLRTNNSFFMRKGKLMHGAFVDRSTRLHSMNKNPSLERQTCLAELVEIALGHETKDIAHGLFSALRDLDLRGVDIIYVEGIEDEGDIAAAVMNRLRKAATIIEK